MLRFFNNILLNDGYGKKKFTDTTKKDNCSLFFSHFIHFLLQG